MCLSSHDDGSSSPSWFVAVFFSSPSLIVLQFCLFKIVFSVKGFVASENLNSTEFEIYSLGRATSRIRLNQAK